MGPENTLILVMVNRSPLVMQNVMVYVVNVTLVATATGYQLKRLKKIEVLRGPSAARYGSGAMGGVVNIITKPVTNDLHGSLSYYTNQPEDSDEGATNRAVLI